MIGFIRPAILLSRRCVSSLNSMFRIKKLHYLIGSISFGGFLLGVSFVYSASHPEFVNLELRNASRKILHVFWFCSAVRQRRREDEIKIKHKTCQQRRNRVPTLLRCFLFSFSSCSVTSRRRCRAAKQNQKTWTRIDDAAHLKSLTMLLEKKKSTSVLLVCTETLLTFLSDLRI